MEPLMTVLRWMHIMAGFTAFFVAPGALLTCKGGAAHRWFIGPGFCGGRGSSA